MRIFVGNFPWETTEEELSELFEQYGEVESCSIVLDRDTGRSRGFGFVKMTDQHSAQTAIEQLNGVRVGRRAINVSQARERS